MDEETIAVLAKLAGLDRALADYPEDVAAAARMAAEFREAMGVPPELAAEPWPPMRVGSGQ